MKRREFVAGMAGVAGGAAGIAGWWRFRPDGARPIPEFARLSFSQQGEDIILYHALHDLLKIDRPTYVDVGAAHPVQYNNTYLLYGTGSTGVLVEPNPLFVKMLRDWRPKDVVVPAGIGVTDEEAADYFEIKGNALLNTFSPEQVAALQKDSRDNVVERVSKMPLININRVIADHLGKAPDLLSTDIEGLDEAIIKTLDLQRFRPGVICCEGVPSFKNGSQSEIARYLVPLGYVQRGGTLVNSVFVDGARIDA